VLAAAALLAGCNRYAEPPPVTRVVGGEQRTGAFVSPHAYEHFIRGEMALARGEHEQAAGHFAQARLGPSDDPLAIARQAEALEGAGQPARADVVLDEGEALAPHSEAVWLARARIQSARGRVDAAIEAFERAERGAPASPEAPLGLAALLSAQGAHARADAVLARFLARVAEGSPAALRARLALAIERRDARGVSRAVSALLRVAPAREDEVRRALDAVLEAGEPHLAVRLLEHLPRRPADEARRVRALLAAGDRAAAEGVLARARAEDFGGPVSAAELWLSAGRPDHAAATLATVPREERTPRVHFLLGRAALATGHPATAAAWLSRVPEHATDHAEARATLALALRAGGLEALADEVRATP
jgi:tetratricopeptide (TPR) repeat protein